MEQSWKERKMKTENCRSILQRRQKEVSALIACYERQMSVLPEGRLKINRRDSRTYYYLVNEEETRILKAAEDSAIIKKLAQRAYAQSVLKAAREEQKILSRAVNGYPEVAAEEIYGNMSEDRRSLVTPFELPDEEYAQAWLKKSYRGKVIGEGVPLDVRVLDKLIEECFR